MASLIQIKAIATRAQFTLLQDAIGAASLCVMFVVALHLPAIL